MRAEVAVLRLAERGRDLTESAPAKKVKGRIALKVLALAVGMLASPRHGAYTGGPEELSDLLMVRVNKVRERWERLLEQGYVVPASNGHTLVSLPGTDKYDGIYDDAMRRGNVPLAPENLIAKEEEKIDPVGVCEALWKTMRPKFVATAHPKKRAELYELYVLTVLGALSSSVRLKDVEPFVYDTLGEEDARGVSEAYWRLVERGRCLSVGDTYDRVLMRLY